MRIAIFIYLCTFYISSIAQARQNAFVTHDPAHQNGRSTYRSTVADLAEDDYDVKHLKFNLNVTNTSTALSGDVTTTARVTAGSMPSYVFELDTAYTIDSAKVNGVLYTVGGTDSIRRISLTTPLTSGDIFTAQIFYHGTIASATIYSGGGMYNLLDPDWGANTLFTVSEPYQASRWWPCKQSLRDKIDSVDMWITVPDSLKAGSNGLLQAVTPVDATHSRYEWKERYPINYYLISMAVAAYTDYSYYMHFSGGTDSMLVQNYIYRDPAFLPMYKNILDTAGLMIDYFSGLYGMYPFAKEKFGHSVVYWGGAQEHQTMTTIGAPALGVGTIAHELGHQWFGNNVTCGTWRDIMMSEGFATYTSYLYFDHFYASPAYSRSYIVYSQNDVKTYDTGSIYVDDTVNEDRILDSRLTYRKGSVVLHTLRSVVNNDSDYFHIFRNYQQLNAGGNGTIDDFKNSAKALLGTVVNGINLDTFFKQWIYLEGFPKYVLHWNQVGSDVYIELTQTTSAPASVPLFKVPIEFRLHAVSGDTVVRILNDQVVQTFHFTYGNTLTGMFMDPNCWLTYKLLSYVHDLTLGVPEDNGKNVTILSNPANAGWEVMHLPANSSLSLTDMSGRVQWQSNSGNSERVAIPAGDLPGGSYMLNVIAPGNIRSSHKLVKE